MALASAPPEEPCCRYTNAVRSDVGEIPEIKAMQHSIAILLAEKRSNVLAEGRSVLIGADNRVSAITFSVLHKLLPLLQHAQILDRPSDIMRHALQQTVNCFRLDCSDDVTDVARHTLAVPEIER